MTPRLLPAIAVAIVLVLGWSAWPNIRAYLINNNLGSSSSSGGYGRAIVGFSDLSVTAQVPLTSATQSKGLAGRTKLGATEGMLWVYDQPGYPRFWMKGMVMPIDIIWLDQGQIVDVSPNLPPPASPDAQLPLYQPRVPATGVLEVAAGFAAEHGLKAGNPVTIDRR